MAFIAAAFLFLAFPAQAADVVRVASKLDAESAFLGNLIVQSLEADGIRTESRLQLGPTKIVRTALLAGEIDLYPEYTGNGAFFHSLPNDPAWKSAEAGYERVRDLDARQGVVWLSPAPADNTWAIAVRRQAAEQAGLRTMDDFARWVSSGGKVKLAASAEFVDSPAALPSFQGTYGFKLKPEQILVLAGGDTAVTLKAAAQGTSGVDAAMAYSTDGAIDALGLVLLDDDRKAQVVYAPAPVARAEVLARQPRIRAILQPIFASLDTATLRAVNARISVEGIDPKAAAIAYLREHGFLDQSAGR